MDHIDFVISQWNKEKPDLDVSSMETIGRIQRLAGSLKKEMSKTFSNFGLSGPDFDVLATLLRSGPPYELTPGDILSATMVTSGTMTYRLDQLEKKGLIKRTKRPTDKRSFSIGLTDKGFKLINEAIQMHTERQHTLVKILDDKEKDTLNSLLRKVMSDIPVP